MHLGDPFRRDDLCAACAYSPNLVLILQTQYRRGASLVSSRRFPPEPM